MRDAQQGTEYQIGFCSYQKMLEQQLEEAVCRGIVAGADEMGVLPSMKWSLSKNS